MRYLAYALAAIILIAGGWFFWGIFSQNALAGWLSVGAIGLIVVGLLTSRIGSGDKLNRRPMPFSTRGMRASRMMIRKEEGNISSDSA